MFLGTLWLAFQTIVLDGVLGGLATRNIHGLVRNLLAVELYSWA